MEKEGFKEKREDEALPFFFNRRKDFEQKTAAHWQRIASRLKQEEKSGAGQAMRPDSEMLSNDDPGHE